MNSSSKVRAVVETGIMTAISVIIIAASFYIPVFYLIGYFIWPLPLALIYIRNGFKYSVLSVIGTGIIVSLITDPISALAVVAVFGGVGIALGHGIKHKESLGFTILLMFAASFIGTIIVIKTFNLILGYDFISQSIDLTIKSVESMKDIYIKYGVSQEQFDELFKTIFNARLLKSMLPSFIAIYSLITAFISYWLCDKIMVKLGYKVERLKPFSQLYIPTQISMAFMIFSLVGYMFMTYRGNGVEDYILNIYLIFSFMFSVNGLAALSFYFRKRGISKPIVFIISSFLLIGPMAQFLIYIGLADYIFNFRRLDQRKNLGNRKH